MLADFFESKFQLQRFGTGQSHGKQNRSGAKIPEELKILHPGTKLIPFPPQHMLRSQLGRIYYQLFSKAELELRVSELALGLQTGDFEA